MLNYLNATALPVLTAAAARRRALAAATGEGGGGGGPKPRITLLNAKPELVRLEAQVIAQVGAILCVLGRMCVHASRQSSSGCCAALQTAAEHIPVCIILPHNTCHILDNIIIISPAGWPAGAVTIANNTLVSVFVICVTVTI